MTLKMSCAVVAVACHFLLLACQYMVFHCCGYSESPTADIIQSYYNTAQLRYVCYL